VGPVIQRFEDWYHPGYKEKIQSGHCHRGSHLKKAGRKGAGWQTSEGYIIEPS